MAPKPCVKLELMIMGPIQNNVYFIDDGQGVVVVDPTEDAPRINEVLDGRKCEAIVLTHAHWDHVGAARELRDLTGAPVIASSVDAPFIDGSESLDPSHRRFEPCPVDRVLEDGEQVQLGACTWQALMTPGHTPGSMCLFLDPENSPEPTGLPVLIAGDTLFAGTHGRTDFVGGSPSAMSESLKRLAELPEATVVLTGHNDLTTIGNERFWLVRGGIVR